jgi:hypothetical protein
MTSTADMEVDEAVTHYVITFTLLQLLSKNMYYIELLHNSKSRDSAVGIATGYGLGDRGVRVRVPVESRIFSSPRRPDRLWVPSSLLSNGHRRLFPGGSKAAGACS